MRIIFKNLSAPSSERWGTIGQHRLHGDDQSRVQVRRQGRGDAVGRHGHDDAPRGEPAQVVPRGTGRVAHADLAEHGGVVGGEHQGQFRQRVGAEEDVGEDVGVERGDVGQGHRGQVDVEGVGAHEELDGLTGDAVEGFADAGIDGAGRGARSVHALFHLVGGWTGGKTLAETSADDLEAMLGQHVWTTFNLFKSFSPKLAESKWGRVITISPSTVSNPPPQRGVYTATKAAQETLVLTLAAELKESGVTANIIQVKAINVDKKGDGTTPEEIVAAMQYLFSDEAGKITGARIPLY